MLVLKLRQRAFDRQTTDSPLLSSPLLSSPLLSVLLFAPEASMHVKRGPHIPAQQAASRAASIPIPLLTVGSSEFSRPGPGPVQAQTGPAVLHT
eukprot:749860-Hanusia_phi.AAC.1